MFRKIVLLAAFSVVTCSTHASQPVGLESGALQVEGLSFPKSYTHKNVQAQIAEYDKVYTPEVTGDQQHIQGLFEIAERTCSYAYHYIQQQQNPEKDHACLELEKLYKILFEINEKQNFNALTIYNASTYISSILDSYNIGEKKERIYKFNNRSTDGILPVIILSNLSYQNSRTFVSYSTYVDQYFKPGSKRWVYQIEPNYQKITQGQHTKKMPHYGIHGNISNFFTHDFFHKNGHLSVIKKGILFYKLVQLNNMRERLKDNKNSYEILTNALFYLIHEGERSCFEDFYTFLSNTGGSMQLKVGKRDSGYKKEIRDEERLLKTRNQEGRLVSLLGSDGPFLKDESKMDLLSINHDGKTLFSQLTPEKKQEAVKKGYNLFWATLIQIMKENGFEE